MSVTIHPPASALQPPPYPMHQFSVDEYHRMIQTGILTEDDAVELLEGWIVPKMPRNPPHDGTIQIATEVLRQRLPSGWQVRVQSALTTGDSEPEPDLAIVRGDTRTYLSRHPGPQDTALVVEVADSSLNRDRQDKGRLYARASIVCYWIINLVDEQVEVYTAPSGPDANPGYRQRQDYDVQSAVPLMIDGQDRGPVPVRDLLP
jgi:Uma2 family endonuclease